MGAGGSDLRPEEVRQFVLEPEATHQVLSHSELRLLPASRRFHQARKPSVLGSNEGRQLRDTPQSSFWSGIPGSMGHLGLPRLVRDES